MFLVVIPFMLVFLQRIERYLIFLSKSEFGGVLTLQKEKSSNFNFYNIGGCQWSHKLWNLAVFDTKIEFFFKIS